MLHQCSTLVFRSLYCHCDKEDLSEPGKRHTRKGNAKYQGAVDGKVISHQIELFHLPTLMHNSLFINNMSVTLLSSTCFEHYMPIFRRTSCILTASGIVALCKRLHSTPVKSGLSPLLTGVLCSRLHRATIPDAVRIQMGMLMLETC